MLRVVSFHTKAAISYIPSMWKTLRLGKMLSMGLFINEKKNQTF